MAKKNAPTPSSRQARIAAVRKDGGGGANRIVVGAVVAVVAIIAVVGGVVVAERNKQDRVGSSASVPAGAGAMGEGFVANRDATLVAGAPALEVYEDFQCPACAQFEQVMGPTIKELADAGKVRLVYHLKTFLDANLRTTHSLAMGNAAMCAADAGAFQAFHDTVYANMPPQEGQGWTAAQTSGFAEEAGITGPALDTWKECVDDEKYNAYVESTEESSSRAGVNSTPTVVLGGQKLDFATIPDGAALEAAVEAATT